MLPLNLYARVRFFAHLARETAGAASTRSSLLPLFKGGHRDANLGRTAPREREVTSIVGWVERVARTRARWQPPRYPSSRSPVL